MIAAEHKRRKGYCMETNELIAALRVAATVDSHQGRGGPEVVVDKKLCAEAANRLESLDKRWKITRVERDQARQMRERAERLLAQAQGELLELRRNTEPVVHAHWKYVDFTSPNLECSACSGLAPMDCCGDYHSERTKRCPECGAHMDEEVAE
jgi:hypothetical protein